VDHKPCYIIAEIGINHNGSLEQALQLIAAAKEAGCNAVKFQKRTIEAVYSPDELARPRESVFGLTNGDLKRGLEFGMSEYTAIDSYCKSLDIDWFASCWDSEAVDFIAQFNPPFYKIASALLTDDDLLRYTREWGDIADPRSRLPNKSIIRSTGMSTLEQIDHAIEVLGKDDLILLHCMSAYPAYNDELNLLTITRLYSRYNLPVGYSGHELGTVTTVAAVAIGACMIERHITLSRDLWGSDQAASLEPEELKELVRDIRFVEAALGDGIKRVYEREVPVMQKLRKHV